MLSRRQSVRGVCSWCQPDATLCCRDGSLFAVSTLLYAMLSVSVYNRATTKITLKTEYEQIIRCEGSIVKTANLLNFEHVDHAVFPVWRHRFSGLATLFFRFGHTVFRDYACQTVPSVLAAEVAGRRGQIISLKFKTGSD